MAHSHRAVVGAGHARENSRNDIASLKHPDEVSEAELEECVDDATVGRYAGNIDIVPGAPS